MLILSEIASVLSVPLTCGLQFLPLSGSHPPILVYSVLFIGYLEQLVHIRKHCEFLKHRCRDGKGSMAETSQSGESRWLDIHYAMGLSPSSRRANPPRARRHNTRKAVARMASPQECRACECQRRCKSTLPIYVTAETVLD